MKLRLPHKFQAALVAAIASVSFTTVSSGTLGAAAFLLSTQHAAAQDDAYNSLELNYNASTREELTGVLQDLDEEKLAETETPANEVGTGGVDDILQALNEIDSQEVVSPMAAGENIQPAAGYSGVENHESFTDNSYSGTSSNGSEETAAPVAATYTPVLAQAPAASAAQGTASTSGSNFSGLGVSTGDSAAGIGSASLGITGGGDSSILAAPALLDAADSNGTSWPTVSFTGGTTYAAGTQVGNYTLASQMTTGHATAGKFTFTPAVNITGANFRAGDYTLSLWVDVASLNQERVLFIYGSPDGVGNSLTANALQWDAAGSLTLGRGNMTNSYAGFSFDNSNKSTISNLTLPKSGLVNFTLVNTVDQNGKQNATLYLNGEAAGTFAAYNGNMNGGDKNTVMGTYLSSTPVYGNISLTNSAITSELALRDFIGFQTSALIWAGSPSNVWQDGNGAAWQDGTVFHNGDIVVFDNTATNKQVRVNSDISAGYMTVSDTYTFNVGSGGSLEAAVLAGSGGSITKTGAGTMTISGPSTNYDGGVTVSEGTLRVTNADFAAKMLQIATGSGVLELGENVTLANGQSSQMAGTLSIMEGKTLTMGGAEGHQVSIASFSNVVLDGAQITYDAAASTINGVTVNSGKTGKIKVEDLNTGDLVLGGTTTVNGTLELSNHWNAQFKINKLVGDGTLTSKKDGAAQWMTVTIDSLSDGDQKFTGDLNFAHNNSDNKEKVLINTGDQNVSFRSLSLDYPAGRTMDFTLGADAAIAQMTLTSGTANIAGDHQLTVGTLSGSGPMNIAADVTLNRTNGYTGAINVNSGTLDLTSTVGTGDLTVAKDATLKLEDENLLSVTGNLTLASGSMLDLSGLYEEGRTLTLATYDGSATYEGVIITGLGDGRKATLKDTGNTLQVTFGDVLQGLTWNGTNQSGTWGTGSSSAQNWKDADGTSVRFTNESNALFTSDAAQKTVTINSNNITAGIVQVSDNYTFSFTSNSSNRTLTASELRLKGGSTLTLQRGSGSGTAHKLNITGDLKGNGTVTVGSNTTLTVGGNISIDEEDTITINNTTAATAAGLHADGALVKSGNGTLTINGTNDSYINKTITVNAGTLTLDGTYRVDNLPNDPEVHYTYEDASRHSSDTGVGGFRVTNGTRTVYRVNGGSVSGNAQFTVNDSTVTVENGKYSYADPDYTTLWVNGGAKLDYGEYYEASGGALTTAQVANGATLGLSSAHAVDKLAFQTDDCAINLSGTGAVNSTSGTGSINLVDGTLTMNGENTEFTGDVTVSGGTLKLGNPKALGEHNQGTSQANTITVAQGGTLDLNGTIDANYTYTLDGGTLTNSGRAIDNLTSQTIGLVLNNNSTIRTDSDHDFRLLARGYGNTNADLQNHTLTKTGSGTFEFRNTAITAGKLDVQGGTLLFKDSSGRAGSTAANVDLNGGKLSGQMNLSAAITMQALQASVNNVAINTNGYALTFSGDADTTISGIISGSGSLTKTGNGTLSLTGASNYTGDTTVASGTLALGNTALTLGGDVSVDSDAILSFGTSGNQALNVGGALTLASGSILDVNNLRLGTTGRIVLATTTDGVVGSLDSVDVQGQAGINYTLSRDGNNLILTYEDPVSTLIWRGATNNVWSNEAKATGTNKNWYSEDNVWKNVPFTDYDRVRFMNDTEVQLGSDVNSGRMIVDRGRNLTVDTNGNNFSVGEIEGTGAGLTVIGSQNKTVDFNSETTLKDLTLDGGTVTINDYTNVTNKLTVENGADMTANSYMVANTLNIDNSSVELKSAGNNIEHATVKDSTLTVEGTSLMKDLALRGNSTLTNTNNAELQVTSLSVSGTGLITGTGTVSTEKFLLAPGASATIDGGQTLNITTREGFSAGIGGLPAEINLGDATLTGTASWTMHSGMHVNLQSDTDEATVIDTNGHTFTMDAVLNGTGNLTKVGSDTLVLTADNSGFTGNTTVEEGTLRLDGAKGLISSANVTVKNGASLWLNTGASAGSEAVTLGNTSIASGATLRLAGENKLFIAAGDTLTLTDGSSLDLSSIPLTTGQTSYVLATGDVDYTNLGNIQLTFEHGVHPAPGTTASLEYTNNQLLLHYTVNEPNGLIWDGGTEFWDVGSTAHWHSAETPAVSTTFATYDDVTFEYNAQSPSVAKVTTDDVHATNMYIKADKDGDVNIVELNVGDGRKLDVDFITTEDNTQIKKTGSGTAFLGVADETFSSDMFVTEGTLTAQYVDMDYDNDTIIVTGDLTRNGGTLRVVIGDGYHETDVTFEAGADVQDVNRIETMANANVEFRGETSISNTGQDPVIYAADGTEIRFNGTTMVDAPSVSFDGAGKIYLGEDTTFAQGGGKHTYLRGNVDVTFRKLTSSEDQTFILYDGTSLTIDDVYMNQEGGEQVLYSGFKVTEGETERQSINIGTIHLSGNANDRIAVGSISTKTALDDEQQNGNFYVDKLLSAKDPQTGENISYRFMLANYSCPERESGVGGLDFDVPEVLYLGGSGSSDFSGTIEVSDWNVNGIYSGTADHRKDTLVILNDDSVARDAVIQFNVKGEYSDFGLGINAEHIEVLGISGRVEGGDLPGDDTFLIYSGTIGNEKYATYGSDNVVRTLEITGDDDYESFGTIDKNLNLVKSGTGTQTFTGATDRFDANIDIQDGVLAFTKANASLTVEDLTLGAHGSKTDTTLSVRNTDGSEGTVELKGTLKAHGEGQNTGAALDANLTLGQDAVLDVHETLTRVDKPDESEYHADYFGGLNMLGNSITLTGQSVLSDSDLQNLMGMQWGDRYELAFKLSSLTVGGVTYTEAIEFDREHLENNIDASLYFSNLQAEDYYICYSGAGLDGPGGNVGTFYIFKAPEPTTSTLSLLALCALTARRRRKN